ncbi:hypothetical protein FM113_00595 [Leucobacter sp. 7(1)]|nr:hypothetical protein FM113_00595 [Leucobacter sp. 7(1)]
MRIQKPADLARLIKTRRQAQGLTQQDVAAAAGITRQSLARVERGHGGVSFDTTLRIFERLGIQLDAVSRPQTPDASPAWARNLDDLRRKDVVASMPTSRVDAQAIIQNIDVAALAKNLSNIDTQALTQAHIRDLDASQTAAVATAASRSIDATALLANWRRSFDRITTQLQENAAHTGAVLNERQARHAVLSAAIEAGDPDLKPLTDTQRARPPENTSEVSND